MKSTKACVLLFIKIVLYLTILCFFIAFFLKDYMIKYFKKNTTFNTRTEKVDTLEFPTLIFCIQPGFKVAIMEKYNLSTVFDVMNFENESGSILDELSYVHGLDYEIQVMNSWSFKDHVQFDEMEIFTFMHGKCHKMQPISEINATQRVSIDILWKSHLLPAPQAILYLVSNNSWHGLTDDVLPYYHPSKFTLDLAKEDRYQVPISTMVYNFMDGVDDFSSCMEELIMQLNCSTKCTQFYLTSVTRFPLCRTNEELFCVGKAMYMSSNSERMYECHKPKYAKVFNPRANPWVKSGKTNTTSVYFYFESFDVLYKDEMLVIDDGQLIGAIGGSLGLFMGFSFYSYIAAALDAILKQRCRFS